MVVAVTDLKKVPETCGDCPYLVYEYADYGRCPLTDNSVDCEEMGFRACDCPLKEVPDDALSELRK